MLSNGKEAGKNASNDAATAVATEVYRTSGGAAVHSIDFWYEAIDAEYLAQAPLLRDIFGNPFRPVTIDPAWLMPDVTARAQAIYEERSLPAGTLDTTRLAILADALEEAGCTNDDILSHCRAGGDHVRGCWVVDLLLAKE